MHQYRGISTKFQGNTFMETQVWSLLPVFLLLLFFFFKNKVIVWLCELGNDAKRSVHIKEMSWVKFKMWLQYHLGMTILPFLHYSNNTALVPVKKTLQLCNSGVIADTSSRVVLKHTQNCSAKENHADALRSPHNKCLSFHSRFTSAFLIPHLNPLDQQGSFSSSFSPKSLFFLSHSTDFTATWGQGRQRIKPPLVCHLQGLTHCLGAVNQILFLGAILKSEGGGTRIIKGNLIICVSFSPHAEHLCLSTAMQVCFNQTKHLHEDTTEMAQNVAVVRPCKIQKPSQTTLQSKEITPVFITHPVVSGRCERIGHPCPESGSRCLDCNRTSDFH